ncbi:hypothetical protein H310_05051 [Aphanomyces invadans]|uniref:Uncharacterized protein n=1 Tax=Aphanomyces invadans TaxID=157072 RepID=A0A024UBS5_9STRA|nr:hypothetical protein H310_05051 [Aphanomyces invadans]ETW03655.1 hypothetical protein H310_05051 [Aphanomyces invadans]|eukprot:XP_008867884.1 hypothetical protein H310_05051 [Aphanomyces invadans]
MREDPTPPADSSGAALEEHVKWAALVVDAKAKEHPYDCLVCGSKNVALDVKTQHVRCRMCGVSTRNVYAHPTPNDRLREMEKVDVDTATEMLRQILGVFEDPHFKRRLADAKGHPRFMDMVLLHTAVAVEGVRSIVTRFGFADSLEGVMKAIRAIQENAGDCIEILGGLERLRVLFSPRNEFEQVEALQKLDEARVVEEARLRELQREAEVKMLDDAAHERRRFALMRAKKAARGLDPNQTYIPSIRRHPPPDIVLFPGRSAFMTVVADQTDGYTWCFNGVAIPENSPGLRGTRSCSLKVLFFTKAMCGSYTCRCSNDDGMVESAACRVSTAKLTPTLMYRHRVPHVVHDVASLPQCLCFRTVHGPGFGSTTTKRLFQLPEHTLSDAATVAMATWTTTEDGRYGNSTMLGQATSLRPLSQSSWVYFGLATGVLRVDSVSIVNPAVDAEPVKLKTSLPRQAAPLKPVAVTTTQLRMATSLTAIRKVAFLGQNAWLLLSDMHHAIMVYAVRKDGTVVELPTHSLVCPRRIATIATSPSLPYFCITYGYVTPATMELVAVSKSQGCTRQDVPLTHKATCAEFACFGSQVAVGEKRVQYGVLRILNAETKRTNMLVEDAHFGGIQFLRWIPQQHNFVFSVGHDHTMKLWDTTKKECVLAFQLHATAPSDILVTCTAAMECTIVVSTFSKQVEKWTIGSLHHLLQSVGIERSYAIVLIQKHWRGAVTRRRMLYSQPPPVSVFNMSHGHAVKFSIGHQ